MKGTTTLLHAFPSSRALQKADDAYPAEKGKQSKTKHSYFCWTTMAEKKSHWTQKHQLVFRYIPKNKDA